MRYLKNKEISILHGIVSDETLIVTLLDAKTLKTNTVVLKTKEIVKSVVGTTLDDFIPRPEKVIEEISKSIINVKSNQPSTSTDRPRISDPLRVEPPSRGYGREPYGIYDPLRDIGRGDLDPLGRGGGMLFRPDLRHQIGPFNPLAPGG